MGEEKKTCARQNGYGAETQACDPPKAEGALTDEEMESAGGGFQQAKRFMCPYCHELWTNEEMYKKHCAQEKQKLYNR